jgi:hypothetical protein
MAPKKNRRKACWNCDSEVDLDIMICPYCASDLSSTSGRRQEPIAPQPIERIPQPVYRSLRSDAVKIAGPDAEAEPVERESGDNTKGMLLTLLYFLLGSVAFLFSLALLFLADGDTLVLRWQTALWPAFCILGIPLLILGYRSWSHLDSV